MTLLIDSILQVILFTFIPFIWWFIFWRKKERFFHWLGLKKPSIKRKDKFSIFFICTIIFLSVPGLLLIPYFMDVSVLATNQFYAQGTNALIPALLFAFIQTSLAEEIFFRGFLTKRFINKFGFKVGNGLQSLLFGLMHGVLFFTSIEIVGVIAITIFTSIAGWLLGWINEKESNGSIITSWVLHGIVNYLSALYMMFII